MPVLLAVIIVVGKLVIEAIQMKRAAQYAERTVRRIQK